MQTRMRRSLTGPTPRGSCEQVERQAGAAGRDQVQGAQRSDRRRCRGHVQGSKPPGPADTGGVVASSELPSLLPDTLCAAPWLMFGYDTANIISMLEEA